MREYFTPTELAKLSLYGLPNSRQAINRMATAEDWATRLLPDARPASRERESRGGGREYHYSVLPNTAVLDLSNRGLIEMRDIEPVARPSLWPQWEIATTKVKDKARFRHAILLDVIELERGGMKRASAVEMVRVRHNRSVRDGQNGPPKVTRPTIYRWFKMVDGQDKSDWLPALMPAFRAGREPKKIDGRIIDTVRALYLRPEKPSFAACFLQLQAIAKEEGWTLPPKRTLERRFLDDVPRTVVVMKREGEEAIDNLFPAQKRDRATFHAMEAINADGHVWDVFVKNEDGEVFRPVMCAIQDLHSNKIVAWRIGRTLGADLVRLAFADMFRDFGIPSMCWLDNGREFAAKLVTGGTATRYRFKVKEDEPLGFLPALGVDVKWTKPYRGQSKPIERAFRDMADHIAKHPAFAGAYTGHNTSSKPANYGSKAVPIAKFRKIASEGIRMLNAKADRRTAVCKGRMSFDEAFSKSYAVSEIRRATPEQLRQCLLAGEVRKANSRSGAVSIFGNTYWAGAMAPHAGERFTVRYDPDALHASVFIYLSNGQFLCEAPCFEAAGFADVASGRDHANKKKKFRKAQKDLAEVLSPIDIGSVADMIPDIAAQAPEEASVIRPFFGFDGGAALKVARQTEEHAFAEPNYDNLNKNVRRLRDAQDL